MYQGCSILWGLEGANFHSGDEGEGDTWNSGGALLAAVVFIVDHQDFHVRRFPNFILPLLSSLLCVCHA